MAALNGLDRDRRRRTLNWLRLMLGVALVAAIVLFVQPRLSERESTPDTPIGREAGVGTHRVASPVMAGEQVGSAPLQPVWTTQAADPQEATTPAVEAAHPVEVAPVEVAPRVRERRFYGISRATRQANLSFTVAGRIEARLVNLGDRVNEGDVIARLEATAFRAIEEAAEANLEGLRASLDQLQRDHRRIERLVAASAGREEELERVTSAEATLLSNLDAATAQLTGARQQLREATLRAPFSGTVVAVFLESGELAAPGVPVVTVSDTDRVEVEVRVPESFLASLPRCDRVWVDFPMVDLHQVPAEITNAATAALAPGLLFPVVVAVGSESPVAPGMTAEVIFSTAAQEALAVPVEAILDPIGQGPYLFVAEQGIARQVEVSVVELLGERAIIQGDLPAGALVITGGQERLVDGQAVDVQP